MGGAAGLLLGLFLALPVLAQHAVEQQSASPEVSQTHEAGSPSILDVDPGLMVWTVVTFVVLLVVLRFVAWKPLLGALEAREQRIREAVEQAERARRESEELLTQHRQKLEAARSEAGQILEQGKAEALRLQEEILAEARSEAEKSKLRALREVELAADRAKRELWEESTRLATLLAERILGRHLNADDHKRLVDEVLDEIRTARRAVPTSAEGAASGKAGGD